VTEAFHNSPNAPSPCSEGTREQLIADIFAWFDNVDSSCEHVFWLNGLAGTGKSAVARTFADRARKQGRLAATFFFSRNLAETRQPSAIIPTIAYQLALHLPSIRPLICAALDADRHVRDRDIVAQAETLLEPVSRTAISDGPFLVVLDALHDMEMSIVQSDVHHYLHRSFTQLARDRNLALPFPSASQLDELVQRAGSLFVYAAMVVRWISAPGARPSLRLQQVLANDEDEMPFQHKFLDNMYTEILSEAAETSGDPNQHERALKNDISTVVLLQEPVHASALVILVGEERRAAGLLPLLSAVLLVDEFESAPVRMFHPSFPEFIVSKERCRDDRFLVMASEGHLRLATRCLEVMNMHLRENICDIEDPSLPNTEVDHLQRTLDHVAPAELRYACKYWHVHLRFANATQSSLVGSLGTFYTTHLLHWIELLGLLNELPTTQVGLQLLLADLRVRTHSQVCSSCAHF
jgi:hypothetical protein